MTNFESANNIRSSNIVKSEFRLRHNVLKLLISVYFTSLCNAEWEWKCEGNKLHTMGITRNIKIKIRHKT